MSRQKDECNSIVSTVNTNTDKLASLPKLFSKLLPPFDFSDNNESLKIHKAYRVLCFNFGSMQYHCPGTDNILLTFCSSQEVPCCGSTTYYDH